LLYTSLVLRRGGLDRADSLQYQDVSLPIAVHEWRVLAGIMALPLDTFQQVDRGSPDDTGWLQYRDDRSLVVVHEVRELVVRRVRLHYSVHVLSGSSLADRANALLLV